MIFSFSLYAIYLYKSHRSHIFERKLGKLRSLGTLEDGEMYHHQYWKKVLVLVDFQNKANIV